MKDYLKSHDSLLVDLLEGSVVGVSGEGHVTYVHNVIQLVMKGVGPGSALQQAVILSLPVLCLAVTAHWGSAPPPLMREKLAAVVTGLFDHFNR